MYGCKFTSSTCSYNKYLVTRRKTLYLHPLGHPQNTSLWTCRFVSHLLLHSLLLLSFATAAHASPSHNFCTGLGNASSTENCRNFSSSPRGNLTFLKCHLPSSPLKWLLSNGPSAILLDRHQQPTSPRMFPFHSDMDSRAVSLLHETFLASGLVSLAPPPILHLSPL